MEAWHYMEILVLIFQYHRVRRLNVLPGPPL